MPQETFTRNARVVCVHPASRFFRMIGKVVSVTESPPRVNVKWEGLADPVTYRRASLRLAPFRTIDTTPQVAVESKGDLKVTKLTFRIPSRPATTTQPNRTDPL